MKQNNIAGANKIRKAYDFSDSVKNPYGKKLKNQILIRLKDEISAYVKEIAAEQAGWI